MASDRSQRRHRLCCGDGRLGIVRFEFLLEPAIRVGVSRLIDPLHLRPRLLLFAHGVDFVLVHSAARLGVDVVR